MTLVRHDPDRFAALIGATAEERNLDPSLVEKDYWAVEALRAVHAGFEVEVGGQLVQIRPIFKGGTSLSKAFGLIERFSEDVDLLVPVPAHNPKEYSQAERSKVMKAATEAVTDALGLDGERQGGRRGVDLHWRYPYEPVTGGPAAFDATADIRIELTVMGGTHPNTAASVKAMVTEHAETIPDFPQYDDLSPVAIETLAPERTLVEKLAMLHDAASTATPEKPGRLIKAGRHYYDIDMLLNNDDLRSRINAGWVAGIAEDADAWSAQGGFPFTPRPANGFASSPAFNNDALMGIIETSYHLALDWVWGAKPPLDECIASVKEHAALL
ncbi:MAG: nucleotidyl transferase AbiEii/AbiGii toxin family protein [Nitriliruptor sp.]|uniref:nucleotidyl transferase AbiEii/AbiGii toxin family protein n=1 Tax=Nitriliruptor sp. TaxID=2448056 RepID=UPI0034A023B8